MKIKRAFIKGTNWALAGLIGLLGFTRCDIVDPKLEYGTPNADYTVKGTVVDKTTGKPIEGIRVGYDSGPYAQVMYGVVPTPYQPKASVTTNAKGEYKLTDRFSEIGQDQIPVFVSDIDGQENGLYSDTILYEDFKNAIHTGKQKDWYFGEYTVNVTIELSEQKGNE